MTYNFMNKKKLSLAFLLIPIVVLILVFISNAALGTRIQTNPDSIAQTTLDQIQMVYGILGLLSIVSALVGGILFISAIRELKKPKSDQ